jgi:molecular chaperone DnaJ
MAEDLYKRLDLDKNASEADIKKAYRKLARQYHPDVNKDPGAEDTFKKIQKAYDILSDPQKKAQYDQFGVTDDQPGAGGFGGFGGAGFDGGFSAESFEDIFDVFFGGNRRSGRGGGSRSTARQGEDLRYDMELTLEEVYKGISKEIDIFHLEKCKTCSGSGAEAGTSKETCSHCQGSGQMRTVQRTMLGNFSQVTTCHYCNGTGQIIKNPCKTCHGRGVEKKKKHIKVDIPAGVDQGTRLRVSGEGNHGEGGGPAGDLYVFLSVKKHKYFRREGDDIYMELELPFTQLILGADIEVPTLDGKTLLKIPAGTQSNTTLRLKGKGIPHLRGYGNGDHYVKIQVVLPKTLSTKEKNLIEELAVLQKDSKSSENLFEKVKKMF